MKYLRFYFINLILAIVFVGCSSDNKSDNDPKEEKKEMKVINMLPQVQSINLTEKQQGYVVKNNEFAFNFYRKTNEFQKRKNDNITSPMGVSFILGMLNNGDEGQVSKEITSLLGFGENDRQEVNSFFCNVISDALEADQSVTIKIANMIAANQKLGVEIADQYSTDAINYYKAEVLSLDFSSKEAEDFINGWCNKQTEGMIPQIFYEGGEILSPNALLVVLNSIVFKAVWANNFDEKDTEVELFTLTDGKKVELPMMHTKALLQYSFGDDYQAIRLPYGDGDKWSMMVLLPNKGKTVDDIINCLTNKSWGENRPNQSALFDIKIPRFITKTHLDLIGILSELGAPSMFSDDKRKNFNLLFSNYKDNLIVGKFFQDASIEVSEKGTKAAAITVAEMMASSPGPNSPNMPEPQFLDFHCNRPFVYLIEEASSGAIFFIGTYRGENE